MSEVLRSGSDAVVAGAAGSVDAKAVRVLHLFKYFRPDFTGDGLYFEKLFPRLERRGIRNEVIAGRTRAVPGAARTPGVRLFGRGTASEFNVSMLLWFVANAWRFDVVHMHSAVDRLFMYHVVGRLFGCLVVQSCTLDDGLGRLIDSYSKAYRGVVRWLCGMITDVVTISPRLYADTVGVARGGGFISFRRGWRFRTMPERRSGRASAAGWDWGLRIRCCCSWGGCARGRTRGS